MATDRCTPLKLALLLAAILAIAPVAAQETTATTEANATPASPPLLEVVTVTAPRVEIPLKDNPGAATVVDEEDLERSRSKTIAADEALPLVPGVKVDNQADGERVHLSIRGQGILTERGIRRIEVILDGIPLNDPWGFVPDLFDVDWATVQRVEVLKGPASSMYGGGSSGGVINIQTRDGGPDEVAGDVRGNVGSNSFWKLYGEANGSADSMNYRVSASRMKGDGYRVHTAFDATNVYGKFRFDLGSKNRLNVIVAGTEYFNENAEGLNAEQVAEDPRQPNPDALTYNEYQRTRRATVGLTGQFSLTEAQELSFATYYRHTVWQESVPSSVDHRTYDNPGAQLQYTRHGGTGAVKNTFSAGVDASAQSWDDYRHPNLGGAVEGPELLSDQTYHEWGAGVFALEWLQLGPKWSLVGGLRWDRVHATVDDHLTAETAEPPDFDKATGRLGVAFNPDPRYGFYASWGQGFTPPGTEDLANNPDSFSGFNANLVPATSVGEDLGMRGSIGTQGSYDVALFHLDTENDFDRYRIANRPLETFYYNAGSSERNGVETSLAWYPVKQFSARLAYTYSHFKYKEVADPPPSQTVYHDTWLPNSPMHQGYLDLEYKPRPNWELGTSVEAQSFSYVDHTNVATTWGYGLIHLRAAYRWDTRAASGDVSLIVRNAANREYIAFSEPDPDGNSYHPGAGREVFLMARFLLGGRSPK